MNCDWVKQNITLYIYDELPDDARHELEQHTERCAGCAAELKTSREFRGLMTEVLPASDPTPNLLAPSPRGLGRLQRFQKPYSRSR